MNKKQIYMGMAILGAMTFMAAVPQLALAAAPWETPMQTVVNYMTGTTGVLLATVGVIVVGLMACLGKISWVQAGEIVIGIGIVFGAPTIVSMLHP